MTETAPKEIKAKNKEREKKGEKKNEVRGRRGKAEYRSTSSLEIHLIYFGFHRLGLPVSVTQGGCGSHLGLFFARICPFFCFVLRYFLREVIFIKSMHLSFEVI